MSPVAGERTWTTSICKLHDAPLFQPHNGCYCDNEETMMATRHELVELSRLRAAEEWIRDAERDLDELEAERDRLAHDRGRLATALAWLVNLKDGPRDAAYEMQKPRAWSLAREALASLEQEEG